jgi:centromeric protein E
MEEKDGLEIHSQKLAEESYYAKELAAAAAVELKNLAEEVTRLSYENAKLVADLTAAKELTASVARGSIHNDTKRRDRENGILAEEMQKELVASCEREAALEDTLSQKSQRENELLKIIDDGKCHEQDLENELANMRDLVSKMKKEGSQDDLFEFKSKQNGFHSAKNDIGRTRSEMEASDNWKWDGISTLEEAKAAYNFERSRCKELENAMTRLKVTTCYLYY